MCCIHVSLKHSCVFYRLPAVQLVITRVGRTPSFPVTSAGTQSRRSLWILGQRGLGVSRVTRISLLVTMATSYLTSQSTTRMSRSTINSSIKICLSRDYLTPTHAQCSSITSGQLNLIIKVYWYCPAMGCYYFVMLDEG